MSQVYKKFVAVFVLVLIVVSSPLTHILLRNTYAAGQLTARKVTISDSRASATGVTYDFAFTASASTSIKQIDIKFCTQAGLFASTCTAPSSFSVSGATRSTDNISGTGRTDSAPAANQYRSVITTPATQSPLTVTYSLATVSNPSTINTSFFARIITYSDTGTTTIDEGTVAFATLDTTSIAVTASVLENFTFSIAGVASTGTVNSATTNITTTATTIPFGTLAVGTPNIGAHDVTVSTNAGSGYIVSVQATATPPLVSGSNDIDAFSGTYASPTTWSAPAGSTANTNTGYFGYTTEDTDFSGFQTNKWAGTDTTARSIITNATGTTSQTTRIGWEAQVNSIQPAGAYTGTVILVATPTY